MDVYGPNSRCEKRSTIGEGNKRWGQVHHNREAKKILDMQNG